MTEQPGPKEFDGQDTRYRLLVSEEIRLRQEQGCDIAAAQAKLEQIPGEMTRAQCVELFDELARLEARWGENREPSEYARILSARPDGPRAMDFHIAHAALSSKLLGAWRGRCVGCLLGKPVEGWDREDIELMGRLTTGYPLADYLGAVYPPPSEKVNKRFANLLARRFSTPGSGVVRDFLAGGMPTDDDTNYTVLNTLLLERRGPAFTTEDLADLWLERLPFASVCTAEKIAYRNLVNNIPPPECARFLNPGRELIGATIRADAYGYIAPGMPEAAAAMAFKDACLSHVRNGIYGAMWVAAMLAAAFAEGDVFRVIEIGLSEIPASSRLAQAVRKIVETWRETRDWRASMAVLDRLFGKRLLHEGHAINNAAVVAIGLMEGGEDFERGVTSAVMCGYDADCNGATVGSVLGLLHGAEAIADKWTRPLEDTLNTSLCGLSKVRITEMAERSLRMAIDMLLRKRPAGELAANDLRKPPRKDNLWEMPRY